MEAPPSDQELLIINKGKRTKRQRPISPFRLAITDSPSSGDDDISTTTSSDDQFCVHTKEEEKIANYLIMLSKGHFFKEEENIYQVKEDHDANVVNYDSNINNSNNNNNNNNIPKFNSKRYMETTTGSGKAGFYVYECQTCNRTFPSFQALGGHRASHKKPKNMADQQEKKMNFGFSVSSDEDYESPRATTTNNNNKNNNMNTMSSLSLQLSTSKSYYGNITKPASKVHECSICGAEFTSGQALGGHMRRHRGSVIGANSALLYHQMPSESEDTDRNTINNNNNNNNNNGVSLELDLNLPAPENDGVEDNKFQFIKSNNSKDVQNQGSTLKKDQGHENKGEEGEDGRPKKRSKSSHDSSSSPLVFSVPALVDCHY